MPFRLFLCFLIPLFFFPISSIASINKQTNQPKTEIAKPKIEAKGDGESNQIFQKLAKKELNEQKYSYRVKLYIFIIVFIIVLLILSFHLYRVRGKSRRHLSRINEKLEERVIERTFNLSYEIDRHKKTEIELKQNEKRWNQAQEVGNVGNWEYDINKNELWGSAQAFKILRIKIKKSPFYTIQILRKIHPADFKKVAKKLRNLHKSNKKLHLEFRIKSNNTNDIYILVKAEVLYNLELNPFKVVGTIQNITNRKIVENELVKAKEKAEESDRLKSAFLSNMSHEIRTPMNAVIGFSELLSDKSFSNESRMEHIHLIQSNSSKLIKLIDDIIDIAKIEANQLKIRESVYDLNTLMSELFKLFKCQSNPQLDFILNIPEKLENPNISIDGFRLQQIISNLLSNAFKFTDTGKVEFGYLLKGNKTLEFFVRDTGIGIPKNAQKFIFERFRQAEDSNTRLYGGTGLGLAICKSLITQMGGTIWIESEKNHGSVFYFSLPYNEINITPIKDFSLNYLTLNWENKTIIIAEDEYDSFVLLKTFLKKTNINILQAKTGNEVIDLLAKNDNVDLVLMDIQMPDMNGIEAVKIIKSDNNNIPIIAQTAFALPGERQKCNEAGFDNYMTKPISRNKLLKLLNSYLEN